MRAYGVDPDLMPDFEVDTFANFYAPRDIAITFDIPVVPLRVLVLTSIRDVGKVERVGSMVELSSGSAYVKGTIEAALEALQDSYYSRFFEIAAIVTDDVPKDLEGCHLPVCPRVGEPWIHPLDLKNGAGESVCDFTLNIPSDFRLLRRDDFAGRAERKLAFESKLVALMREVKADVIISDHYIGKVDYLIDPEHFGLYGRVLNTHPGITREGHEMPTRGNVPYEDAIFHANGQLRDRSTRQILKVKPYYRTGASFHLLSAEIDAGPVLCDAETTPVTPADGLYPLIARNYAMAKNPVFLEGLRHYAAHIFPSLNEWIDSPLQLAKRVEII